MGRKNNKKRYSKIEFISNVCVDKCFICSDHGLNPTFCYGQLYKKNPKEFIDAVLENYMDNWQDLISLQQSSYTSDEDMLELFRKVVCSTYVCKSCKASDFDVFLCISKFIDQTESAESYNKSAKDTKKASPCVFTHKNLKFNEEIDRILENYSKQQNIGGGIITGY